MADYSQTAPAGQSSAESDCCKLCIPSYLPVFIYNSKNTEHTFESYRKVYWCEGMLNMSEDEVIWCECGCRMHGNQNRNVNHRNIPIGEALADP